METIKVSGDSRSAAVAGAIAGIIRDQKHAEVVAIGAAALNKAIKALILAIDYLNADGIKIYCIPQSVELPIGDKVITGIKLVIDVSP